MLAIGLLSLLGFGVAAAMSTDTVEGSDANEDNDITRNETEDNEVSLTKGDTTLGIQLDDDLSDEEEAEIGDFLGGLLNDPDLDTQDIIDEAQDFIEGLGEDEFDADSGFDASDEADEYDDEEFYEEEEEAVARPPMGPEYNDPIIIADALEAQRLVDEAAAEAERAAEEAAEELRLEEEAAAAEEQRIADEIARQPENLVTVSSSFGNEVADEVVLTTNEDDADTVFTVTAPEDENDIDVGYDDEHTFSILYSAGTGAITAGLNAQIQGPEGVVQNTRFSTLNDDGEYVTEESLSLGFEGSTDITLEVADSHIGTHVAQVDLSNPEDALHFEFDDDVTGDMHLVFSETEEDGENDETATVYRAFIVETAQGAGLSQTALSRLMADPTGQYAENTIVAEIYLGEDSVTLPEAVAGQEPPEPVIANFANEDPAITANFEWASSVRIDEGGGFEVLSMAAPVADATDAANDDAAGDDDDLTDSLITAPGNIPSLNDLLNFGNITNFSDGDDSDDDIDLDSYTTPDEQGFSDALNQLGFDFRSPTP